MGWGEVRHPTVKTASDRLCAAVRAFESHGSATNREKLLAAAKDYEDARERERANPVVVTVVETGRRTGW